MPSHVKFKERKNKFLNNILKYRHVVVSLTKAGLSPPSYYNYRNSLSPDKIRELDDEIANRQQEFDLMPVHVLHKFAMDEKLSPELRIRAAGFLATKLPTSPAKDQIKIQASGIDLAELVKKKPKRVNAITKSRANDTGKN